LISHFCYGNDFKWGKLADELLVSILLFYTFLNILFLRSIIFFENGLHHHMIDAKVSYLSGVRFLLLEETMPEALEALK
jgi:hypothetical protein